MCAFYCLCEISFSANSPIATLHSTPLLYHDRLASPAKKSLNSSWRVVRISMSVVIALENLNFHCMHKSRPKKGIYIHLTFMAIKSQPPHSIRMFKCFASLSRQLSFAHTRRVSRWMSASWPRTRYSWQGERASREKMSHARWSNSEREKKSERRGANLRNFNHTKTDFIALTRLGITRKGICHVTGGGWRMYKKTHNRKQKKCVLRRIYNSRWNI